MILKTVQPGEIDEGEGSETVAGVPVALESNPFTPRMSFAPASPASAPLARSATSVKRLTGMPAWMAAWRFLPRTSSMNPMTVCRKRTVTKQNHDEA